MPVVLATSERVIVGVSALNARMTASPRSRDCTNECQRRDVASLAGLDASVFRRAYHQRMVQEMQQALRKIYFTPSDTRDVGYIETEHFGVRFPHRSSYVDLTCITQRWLRDLLWDHIADVLRSPASPVRRSCSTSWSTPSTPRSGRSETADGGAPVSCRSHSARRSRARMARRSTGWPTPARAAHAGQWGDRGGRTGDVDVDAIMPVVAAVNAYAIGAVRREIAERRAERATGTDEKRWHASLGPCLERAFATGRFPALATVVRDAAHLDADHIFRSFARVTRRDA
ncbi:hypothetical protein [Streptomyces sp. NPDC002845]